MLIPYCSKQDANTVCITWPLDAVYLPPRFQSRSPQDIIPTAKTQFDFTYEIQTQTPSILIPYWTDYRLEALWTISVLIVIGMKIYKRFQQYRKYQSSAFIIGLAFTSEKDECDIITLRRFEDCMQRYDIHAPTFIQSIQCTVSLTCSKKISYGLTFVSMTIKITKSYTLTQHSLSTTSLQDVYEV